MSAVEMWVSIGFDVTDELAPQLQNVQLYFKPDDYQPCLEPAKPSGTEEKFARFELDVRRPSGTLNEQPAEESKKEAERSDNEGFEFSSQEDDLVEQFESSKHRLPLVCDMLGLTERYHQDPSVVWRDRNEEMQHFGKLEGTYWDEHILNEPKFAEFLAKFCGGM